MRFRQPHNKKVTLAIFLSPHVAVILAMLSTIAVDNPVHTLVSVGVSKVPVWDFAAAVKF
jgi:hypothetical protein